MVLAALKPGRREGNKSPFFLHNFLNPSPDMFLMMQCTTDLKYMYMHGSVYIVLVSLLPMGRPAITCRWKGFEVKFNTYSHSKRIDNINFSRLPSSRSHANSRLTCKEPRDGDRDRSLHSCSWARIYTSPACHSLSPPPQYLEWEEKPTSAHWNGIDTTTCRMEWQPLEYKHNLRNQLPLKWNDHKQAVLEQTTTECGCRGVSPSSHSSSWSWLPSNGWSSDSRSPEGSTCWYWSPTPSRVTTNRVLG